MIGGAVGFLVVVGRHFGQFVVYARCVGSRFNVAANAVWVRILVLIVSDGSFRHDQDVETSAFPCGCLSCYRGGGFRVG